MASGGAIVKENRDWLDYVQLWGVGASVIGAALYVGSFTAHAAEQDRRLDRVEKVVEPMTAALAATNANVQYLVDRERSRDQRGQ